MVFVSSQVEDLANFVTYFESLLAPLRWHHTYVTVVPETMAEGFVSIPTPCLLGILDDPRGLDWSQLDDVSFGSAT